MYIEPTLKKYESLTHLLTDNLKARDASASKKRIIDAPGTMHRVLNNTGTKF